MTPLGEITTQSLFGPPIAEADQEEPPQNANWSWKKIAKKIFFFVLLYNGLGFAKASAIPASFPVSTLATSHMRSVILGQLCPTFNCSLLSHDITVGIHTKVESFKSLSGDRPPLIVIEEEMDNALIGKPSIYTCEEVRGVLTHELGHIEDRNPHSRNLRETEFVADAFTLNAPNLAWGLRNFLQRTLLNPNNRHFEETRELTDDVHPSHYERIDRINRALCQSNPAVDPDYDFGICAALGFNQCPLED